ncbi:OmpA family protein [Salinisphaera aquimarina]|uniref:OmpA family protein n=1 Tax=Salinisphaera aquimarina TaxID=2094031 RepID=A0ABV7EVT5_9GAMM
MKRVLITTLAVLPLFAGCALVTADPVPPSPALVGVNAQNAAWESQVERTRAGAGVEFTPLEDARRAVDQARAQDRVESYDADALAQAEAALAKADAGWEKIADRKRRPVDKLADVADDAHRAQRLAEIARYTAIREINLEQLNQQIESQPAQTMQGGTAATGIAGSGANLLGKRVIPDRLGDVAFETGTARLTAPSRAVVQRLAAVMRDNPKYGVAILGHTDNVAPGDASIQRFVKANPGLEEQAPTHADQVRAFNLALSSARARSVARTLVENGVEARRIGARGFGDTRPIASNDTPEGRRANRRIEAVIVPGPDSQAAQQAGSGS